MNVCKLKREKKAFEIAKVNSRCFQSFPAAILVSLRWTPSWRVHTKLSNFFLRVKMEAGSDELNKVRAM